jgi:hypothetical protein
VIPPARLFLLLLLSLCLLGACDLGEDDAEPAPLASEGPPRDPLPSDTVWPAQIERPIMIEGMQEPLVLSLFEAPATFPLSFRTYVPEDMRVSIASTATGEAVLFSSDFGGPPEGQAVLEFLVFGESVADEATARAQFRQLAADLGEVRRQPQLHHDWALAQFAFEDERSAGSVALGQHGGRFFYMLFASPPELEEGFRPRVRAILEEWRWRDSRQPL